MNEYFLDFIMRWASSGKDNYKLYSSQYDTVESMYIKHYLMSKQTVMENEIDSILNKINQKFSIYDNGIYINTCPIASYYKEEINKDKFIEYAETIYKEIIQMYNKNMIFEGDKISSLKRTSVKNSYVNQVFNVYCLKNNLDCDRFYPRWDKNVVKFFPYDLSGYIKITIKDEIIEIENWVSA